MKVYVAFISLMLSFKENYSKYITPAKFLGSFYRMVVNGYIIFGFVKEHPSLVVKVGVLTYEYTYNVRVFSMTMRQPNVVLL